MQTKIAKSYKFSPNIVDLIDKLCELPEYASATHLIEVLINEKAKTLGISDNGNGTGNENATKTNMPQ